MARIVKHTQLENHFVSTSIVSTIHEDAMFETIVFRGKRGNLDLDEIVKNQTKNKNEALVFHERQVKKFCGGIPANRCGASWLSFNKKRRFKMNQFKLKSYLKEFPFIPSCLPGEHTPDELDDISIARIDENLLARIPLEYSWDGSAGASYDFEAVSFVLDDLTVQHNTTKQEGESGSNYAHSQRSEWEGETVLEALSRLSDDELSNLKFIVWYSRHLNDWISGNYENERKLTIYKLPKKISIRQEIAKAQKTADAKVKAESDF